jgi:predicted nucleotidyltransferase
MNSVVERLKEASPEIRKRFRIKRLGVFGSYAKNKMQTGSDLDIVFDLEENVRLSFKELILLEEFITRKTGISEIDLVRTQYMNPLVWLTVKDTVIYV